MNRRLTRRAFVAGVAAGLGGCGGLGISPTPTPPTNNPADGEVEQVGELSLTSSAFDDGEPIPQQYGRRKENINPPLSIGGVPASTETFALIVDDPDALDTSGKVWLHWLLWNIPSDRTEIPADWNPTDVVVGWNDFDQPGYDGPAPPGGRHRYRFKLFAVDTSLDIPRRSTKNEVGTAMRDDIVGSTQLTGTFAP